ncbi:MAG: DsbA family protein [Candidatus Omnitrophica bacterium]|nr:DsbA family protein [Candidatus Omnitrophota bacterium]
MKRRFAAAGVVLVSVLVSGVLLAKKGSDVTVPAQQPSLTKTKGPAGAPVEILEYSDFQCPACQRAQAVLQSLDAKYPGQIRFVYRHFPLAGHVWSGIAHQAAECAASQNRFWDYHDVLFKNQTLWSAPQNPSDSLLRYARDLGLNLDAFGACLADETVRGRVQADKQTGVDAQVNSTPTFFINGERVAGHIELGLKGEAIIRKILNLEPSGGAAEAKSGS